jgi:cobalamin biosynthesis Mg chelatase CobN
MGWASGGYIFDPVCEALQQAFLVPEARKKILVTLIKALQDGDWDTESESLEQFADDPVVVAAFQECGHFLWGTPEYDIEYGDNSVSQKMMQEGK